MKLAWRIFIAVLLVIVQISDVWAYKEETHSELNKNIAVMSSAGTNSSLNNYLINQLEFPSGIYTDLRGKNIQKWLSHGGKAEDYLPRPVKHFHDPMLQGGQWDQAGYGGSFDSSVIWAQDQNNSWSWPLARKYYFAALTGNSSEPNGKSNMNKDERDVFFAKTFRALGQLLHLVEDSSVPAHVRNDGHLISSILNLTHYEKAVQGFIKNSLLFDDAYDNSIAFDPSILSGLPNPLARISIAKIIDTDKYSETSGPDITIGNDIGLAEYTNANFLSEGTIRQVDEYPTPNIDDEDCRTIEPRPHTHFNGDEYIREYYKKKGTPPTGCGGETNNGMGYLLAAVDMNDYERQKNPHLSAELAVIPVFDNNVYKDYASLLLPRAVGYSKGLLEYFFRGEIDMTYDSNSGGYKIENIGTEDLDGTFSLFYDGINGERNSVPGAELQMKILAKSESPFLNITEPSNPEPKLPGKYMLVFKGMMGDEENAVAGKVVCPAEKFTIQYSRLDMGPEETQLLSLVNINTGEPVNCSNAFWSINQYPQPADWDYPTYDELIRASEGDSSLGWLTNLDGSPLVGKASKVIYHSPVDICEDRSLTISASSFNDSSSIDMMAGGPALRIYTTIPDELIDSELEISLVGGCPPYNWSLTGEGFYLEADQTEEQTNIIYDTNDGFCGDVTLTVEDNAGQIVEARIKDEGRMYYHAALIAVVDKPDGWLPPGCSGDDIIDNENNQHVSIYGDDYSWLSFQKGCSTYPVVGWSVIESTRYIPTYDINPRIPSELPSELALHECSCGTPYVNLHYNEMTCDYQYVRPPN